tara:strand:- start:741 stop:1031 length:291 start_codon:yes stop_codon:yes gene_type:complete
MRTINGYTEEIKSYDHNIGNFVRVLVGVGEMVDNAFVFNNPQQFQTYIIFDYMGQTNSMTGAVIDVPTLDYTNLLALGPITVDTLWTIIDIIRARV